MKLVTVVLVLAVLSTLDLVISKKAKLKRKRKTHRDMMQELAAYGEEQLKEFKKRNPIREGSSGGYTDVKESFEAPRQKKKKSRDIEDEAVFHLAATKKLISDTGRCLSDLQNDIELQEIWRETVGCMNLSITCDEHYEYRSADGSCNNLVFPEWGQAFTPQIRFVEAHYEDGVDYPRDYDLPSPRLISNKLFATDKLKFDRKKTAELMAWGQLLAHDIILTPLIDGSLDCCATENEDNPACFPIEIPDDDPYFTSNCMSFVRSSPAATGCVPAHREQINEITTYIDGSMLYGSSEEATMELREFSAGLLKESKFHLLPVNTNGTCIRKRNRRDFCQLAGDVRVDVVPNLGANHLLLVREHNRIADQLSLINPHWDDERIFQETRKIVAAEIQHITYSEYLPILVGPQNMLLYDLTVTDVGFQDYYDSSMNPSIRNSFAAAAFRFGHSQIMPKQSYLLDDYATFRRNKIQNHFMTTTMLLRNKGQNVTNFMRWLSYDKSMGSDRFFEKEVRDLLFLKDGKSSDLPARNIQRGRDHGLPSYNEFRRHCGLSTASRWNPNNENGLVDIKGVAGILKSLYNHIDDIDLYVGGMTEMVVEGGIVGPTFACLIGEQFEAFKKGDRFWYERPDSITGFTRDQLDSIKQFRLSKMFCENFDLDEIQSSVFDVVNDRNPLVPCSKLPDLDLDLWREDDLLT